MPGDWDVVSTKAAPDPWSVAGTRPVSLKDKLQLTPEQQDIDEQTSEQFGKIGQGIKSVVMGPTMSDRAKGLHQAFSTAVSAAAPGMLSAFGPAAPAATVTGVAAGAGGYGAAKLLAGIAKIPEEYGNLLADAIATYTGYRGAKAVEWLKTPAAQKILPKWLEGIVDRAVPTRIGPHPNPSRIPYSREAMGEYPVAEKPGQLAGGPLGGFPSHPRPTPPPTQEPFTLEPTERFPGTREPIGPQQSIDLQPIDKVAQDFEQSQSARQKFLKEEVLPAPTGEKAGQRYSGQADHLYKENGYQEKYGTERTANAKAKDQKINKYLHDQSITKSEWNAANHAQKAQWVKGADSKFRWKQGGEPIEKWREQILLWGLPD